MLEKYNVRLDKGCTWMIGTPPALTQRLPFYLCEWGHFITLKDYYTTRENYPQYLLFHTLGGRGKLTYDNREYVLSKNTVAVIWCEKNHRYETSGERWEYNWFHYSGGMAHDYYMLLNGGGGALNIQKIKDGGTEAKLIEDIISNGNQYELIKDLHNSRKITHLMTMLISQKIRIKQDEAPALTEKINRALNFMQDHLTGDISLESIADAANVSKFHFIRIFKEQTGITPHEYLINLRVSRAKELLISTDTCLDEIAEQTGFGTGKNLIYNFKLIARQTPGEYRKTHLL